MILIDARGHGASDQPRDPAAYDLTLRASDVVSVLDALGVRKASYFGYSLGGWIGFGLAKQAPERFDSFVIGAAHPYAENLQPFRDSMLGNLETFAAGMERSLGNLWKPAMRARLLNNDLEALRALTQDRASVADVLPTMTVPCLLFGELDARLAQVRECSSRLPRAALFTLPGCDHVATLGQAQAIVPQVKRFLSNVTR